MPNLESKARRLAKKVGLIASRSRWRRDTVDNLGGFRLIELVTNTVVAGERYDMSPEEVIEYCTAANATS